MKLAARVLPGLQELAAAEVRELTGRETATVRGRVFLEGGPEAVYRLNHASGCLLRVLVELGRTSVETLEEIQQASRELAYENFVPPGRRFAVRAKRYGDHEFTSMDVADRVGEAVIDRVRTRRGDRLPVDLDEPEAIVRVMVRGDRLSVGLDTTGQSLHRRGYRRNRHSAPLNPTAARALLRMAQWGGEPLLDPFCGSGTIPIEAAGWAHGHPPGRLREAFLFENLAFFDESVWSAVRREPAGPGFDPPTRPLKGTDRSTRCIDFARENARRAGVSEAVEFRVAQLEKLEAPGPVGCVVANPPFGQRSGRPYRMEALYRTFWERMRSMTPVTVAAVSGNADLEATAPSPPDATCPVMLGDRHCRLVLHRLAG